MAHGSVIAGAELDKLGLDDVTIDAQGRVAAALPRAQIFITAQDTEKSHVYDREIGLLCKGEIELESAARLAAERAMEQVALLEQAQANAERCLYRSPRDLGFSDVGFTVDR